MTAHFPSMANYEHQSHNNWLILKGGTSFPACLGYLTGSETAHHKLTGKRWGMFTPCDEAQRRYPWANGKQVVCSAEPCGLTTPSPEAVRLGLHRAAIQLTIAASRDEVPQLSKLRNLCARIQTCYSLFESLFWLLFCEPLNTSDSY